MVARLIEEENESKVVAFSVNKQYCSEDCIEGYPVVPFEDLADVYKGEIKILNTVGYTKMNTVRERLYSESLSRRYSNTNFISRRAIVMGRYVAGQGTIVLPGAVIGDNVSLGHGNIVYSGVVLTHDICMGNFNFFAAGTVVGGFVDIGNNCFIGLNATVKNRVTIADMTLIGSGANVVSSTEKNTLYLGNPASKIIGKTALDSKI